jgi:hypothetical protein
MKVGALYQEFQKMEGQDRAPPLLARGSAPQVFVRGWELGPAQQGSRKYIDEEANRGS